MQSNDTYQNVLITAVRRRCSIMVSHRKQHCGLTQCYLPNWNCNWNANS